MVHLLHRSGAWQHPVRSLIAGFHRLSSSPSLGRPARLLRPTGTRRRSLSVGVACAAAGLVSAGDPVAGQSRPGTGRTSWPQPYTVQRDETAGTLTLRTSFYSWEHDLKRGGIIRRITLAHGRATNLLARPIQTRVQDENGVVLTDLMDPNPTVQHKQVGENQTVTVESALADPGGHPSKLRVRSTYDYRWGYVKIRREFLIPTDGFRVREVSPFLATLTPSLSDYGYREGTLEEDGAASFAFGSNRWGKLRRNQPSDRPLDTSRVPRSMIFVDPGVEGLEWFVGSELAPWDRPFGGQRGQGRCQLQLSQDPPGLALSITPFWSTNKAAALPDASRFDFSIAVPLLEGHAQRPWLHTSFNRNRGNWVSPEEIRRWATNGYQTVHCHNDGDYDDDGLFWRDGAYPPYPDMDQYDRVLTTCRQQGIRTATYFSNKELHPSTRAFQEHGIEWGRMNRKGDLQHNMFRGPSEFGAQMCLRSGWLACLKSSIDRVLKNHPLDGVYYDWNVALLCYNARHEPSHTQGTAQGHWDIDELLDLMEWTRQRVGPNGLVILHNTTTPMFAMENFADAIVATEWGYEKWTHRAPDLESLPLEWSLAGARTRGVISYGTIDSQAPRRLHKLFALEALLGGVTPWPASPEAVALASALQPIGNIEACQFADWRNQAVRLSDSRCASAVYSRPNEAFLLLANLESTPRELSCTLDPRRLPHPLDRLVTATRLDMGALTGTNSSPRADANLDVRQLVGDGLRITLPGDDAILIHVR